jgi:asparagine synthase (glutamine-hydrolysing)
MCGINGIVGRDEETVTRMVASTGHRGPDGTGIFVSDMVTLGHNLLAITDNPKEGHQPFVSPDKRYALVYNGEIYNYEALRKELESLGDQFSTKGDTEVLFKGMVRFGEKFLDRLDGMFALAFYDEGKGTLLLARDRFGIKPLYLAKIGGRSAFSSEVRGLLAAGGEAKLDIDAVKLFFYFGYVPGPKTLFRGIEKLSPGLSITFDLRSKKETRRWFTEKSLPEGPKEIVHLREALRDVLGRSVIAHTMGLRPFGLFLSGGMDSTALLHELAQREKSLIKTYTTRFEAKDGRYNEDADLAKRLAGDYHIDHHELLITEQDFIDAIPATMRAMEEPRYNHSTPAYWLLSREAAKDIVVVLDGSGGDELFLGYPKYLVAKNILERYARYPKLLADVASSYRAWKSGVLPFGRFASFEEPLATWALVNRIMPVVGNPAFRFMKDFDVRQVVGELRAIDGPSMRNPQEDSLNSVAALDQFFWLADENFLRTDKIAMHFGLEGRFPFLARDVVAYAESLSSEEKISLELKRPIREAYRGVLPAYITEKRKSGWNAPVPEWMGSELGKVVRGALSKEYYPPTAELFDFDALHRETLDGISEHSLATIKKFLPIFYFQVWAKEFNTTI